MNGDPTDRSEGNAGKVPPLPPLRDVIARHGLSANRALGQNFLFDLNLTGRIARAAAPLDAGTVIEIGPGPGGLTRALLDHGAGAVIVIERDRRFLPVLAEISAAYPGRLQVIEGDALKVDAAKLGSAPRRIVANLPYNVATPLLLGWLDAGTAFTSLTLMFQKEVAERLLARPKTKDYGRLTIAAQWRADVKRLFDIPPRAFTPPPKVTSTVVQLIPRAEPLFAADATMLERVTAAAFGQRRKMLRQSLRQVSPQADEVLVATGIAPTARGEELSIEQFCALARAFKAEGPTGPRAGL
ncbi:16S rRNA (adenine(1518)-N(6)/adenine(1519)-N(6))-dimethyltransferase RsmA [Dongia rigui]|uniref:Ribosomal RNA small subunit methyltransferase A n=1 Tax=Dongia rigui TaxID=940149 RepID=A0ABU5DTV8_9PROT|nr:16S rRNA (adenine(1518)-N(6)/adenine(1519)-N(6))-dimethyltransferase RsmA [Dongia rigui]MDY0870756.1 16S rRNA (adenine(1518)-N(6)/adenine(1519)-N(6))-dimethyltransferase RsmA [Dongia rigui]